jgi:endonuclease/exonuclease/phosphatase family metal-dependent hydrolase
MPALKLLCWNIWMMPSLVRQSPKNEARAAAIAEALLEHDFDLVVFTKAFDGAARRVLEGALEGVYPHQAGPVNASGSPFSIHGGVWVLSRLPLSGYHEIRFHETAGVELFARKGALLVTAQLGDRRVQIAATHLKGDDGPVFDAHFQEIRNHQMTQIEAELLAPHRDPELPLFLCGDFGTPHFVDDDPSLESEGYTHMLRTFQAENGPGTRITLDDSSSSNDLAIDDTGRTAELDYILLRRGKTPVRATWERVILQRPGWEGSEGRRDLSYRYAVAVSAELG